MKFHLLFKQNKQGRGQQQQLDVNLLRNETVFF